MRRSTLFGPFVALALGCGTNPPPPPVPPGDVGQPPEPSIRTPLRLAVGGRLSVWWDALPDDVLCRSMVVAGRSNVHPADYVGPETCKGCHTVNHQAWANHPHRRMNALAGPATVRGDFSGTAVSYRGGRITFETRSGDYHMRLERGGVRRSYRVNQTIGARFFQYYVGKQLEGPESPDHHFYHRDHVLPFGYWLDREEWVPVVHIGPERPDEDRPDPFAPPDRGPHYADYAVSCNYCHTTFPLGDLFARRPHQIGAHLPVPLHWSVRGFMEGSHPNELTEMVRLLDKRGGATENPMAAWEAVRYAVTLGVSCEACHLGGREHVESKGAVPPRFFPTSPHLYVEGRKLPDGGRTRENANWACGRCHTGSRPAFAAGMSTWNSVEYSDAVRGSCYSQLRCTDCHEPHAATGPTWTRSPARDDAVCLKCHDRYRGADRRAAHTRHPPGSAGDRCLNCHMPRINEGLQDVVRTHMIYSPTRADMIEANHPNACNLCHTDRPIDWTLRYLKDWYGREYDPAAVTASYPDRTGAVAAGWLRSPNESVRLVGADALVRARDPQAIPGLLDALDDPFLLNRQFAVVGLGRLGVRPADAGYRFYMTAAERRRPLDELRAKVAPGTTPNPPPRPLKVQSPQGTEPR